MTQPTLFPELGERPPCTCHEFCEDICRGYECGCRACQWDFDEFIFEPVYICCSKCGEVIAIEYEEDFRFPQGFGKAKCCQRDLLRVFYGEPAKG